MRAQQFQRWSSFRGMLVLRSLPGIMQSQPKNNKEEPTFLGMMKTRLKKVVINRKIIPNISFPS